MSAVLVCGELGQNIRLAGRGAIRVNHPSPWVSAMGIGERPSLRSATDLAAIEIHGFRVPSKPPEADDQKCKDTQCPLYPLD